MSGGRCLDPLGLLDGLIALDAACLAAPALRLLQEAARSASLGAEAVGPRLTRLVEGGSLEALAALNAPWARQVALPRGAVIAALTDPARAPAAVAVLAGRQEADLLWALARASCAARARRRSASWARWPPWRPICCGSPRAIRSRSGPASAPRSWPPTLAGSSSRRGRRRLHRPGPPAPRWLPAEVAGLCHPVRDALVAAVSRRDPLDPAWPRLLPVLVASEATAAPAAVRALLARPIPPVTARVGLEAIANLEDSDAEAIALDLLPRFPPRPWRP
ncbi:MAG: hypothetical protein R3F43_02315 [bacterium]